ncbi:hypothetical protein FHW69_000985 [Luteibacter sp. Sphag1AF]|uniref:DUF6776 family protein n=1 Tax=Luteibacter sp. Sphag1AF TaxID=2587031 RepID=UPI001608C815|nr:DUF6776 family protein [Luteibacter sp. Sphag1AF]MBB3226395.1 hypothetical protein [Luteibacter sp. Sphag1AF]
MASTPPPRFVVRTADDVGRQRRTRLLLAGAWATSLLVACLITWALTAHTPALSSHRGQIAKLTARNDELLQQLANVQRSGQVSDIATKELKRNLAERDEEISGLRTDLAFYSRLVGGGAQREGLQIQDTRVSAVTGTPRAWNIVLTLTQNARRGDDIKGKATLAIEGIRGDKVVTLEGSALGETGQGDGLAFSFKYFQQVHGSFVLPADFKPTRLRITVTADGSTPVTRSLAWAEVTQGEKESDVQR